MLPSHAASLFSFLEGPAVCELVGTEFAPEEGDGGPLYQRVSAWYTQRGQSVINVPVIGPVRLDKRAITRSIRHGLSRRKAVAFAAVPHVLIEGRIVHEESLVGSGSGRVYSVAAPVEIAQKGYIVVVMVKKDQVLKGHFAARMYLHSVIAKEKLRQSAYTSGVGLGSPQAHDTHQQNVGVAWKCLRDIYKVKLP